MDVALDTSVLVNFLLIDRTRVLGDLPGLRFHVLNHVVQEVVKEPPRSRLQSALFNSHLSTFEMTDLGATADYEILRARLGDGEAATIAAATHNGWVIGLDERRRAKKEAIARVGVNRLINTAGILVRSVQTGVLSLNEAEQIRVELSTHRFRIKETIAELCRA